MQDPGPRTLGGLGLGPLDGLCDLALVGQPGPGGLVGGLLLLQALLQHLQLVGQVDLLVALLLQREGRGQSARVRGRGGELAALGERDAVFAHDVLCFYDWIYDTAHCL